MRSEGETNFQTGAYYMLELLFEMFLQRQVRPSP